MLPQEGSNACNRDNRREIVENSEKPATNRELRIQHLRRYQMRTFLASSTVFLTILFSFAFGIACGYVVIVAILRTFAHKPEAAAAQAQAAIATPASSR